MFQRKFLPVVGMALTLSVPVSVLGQEPASAMVYANGSASVNGTEIPKSAAVFPGDALQTKADASASIATNGSSVMISPESIVKYEGPSVAVDHGSVRIVTASGFEAHACDVWAKPVSLTPTQYQFTHVDGHVTVIATKGDVIVEDRKATRPDQGSKTDPESKTDPRSQIVKEGEQATREDGCEVAARTPKRPPSAPVGIGNPALLYTGIGAGGILIWVLLRGHDRDHVPISPTCPTEACQ